MSGAVVTMRSPEGAEAIVAHTDAAMRAVAELEFDLGEGPTRDSWDTGRPQFVSDLAESGATWVGFAAAAIGAGVRAAYVVPLHVGAARFGAFTTYSARRRKLDREETRQVLVLAELATEVLLDTSSAAPNGEIDPHLQSALDVRSEIYQAQGMVMVSLNVGLPEALARMRAHAFASEQDLIKVAIDIIDGRFVLDDDTAS